ncbi:MAG: signal transduction histidine kinase [Saprospiraceae bacterium]
MAGLFPVDVHDSELALSTREHDKAVLNSGKSEVREEQAKLVSDGQLPTLLTIKFPVFNVAGEVNGLGAIVTDITETKQLEESLQRSQKMDAVGQLTGGIAHDFNNILAIALGNLALLRNDISGNQKALFHLDAAESGANRAKKLTRKLLGFAQTTARASKRVSLNELIRGMNILIPKSLNFTIETKVVLEQDLWPVNIDEGDFEDVILNLSLNARDAMPEGGQLTIKTSKMVFARSCLDINPQAIVGEFVLFSVGDNESGMTADVQKRSMEPFFTTKETNKGSGLGLSMVYGFVKRSGGFVTIDSEPDQGTEVKIYLPKGQEDKEKPNEHSMPLAPERGHETILIVDDEAGLLDVGAEFLQGLGYKTVTASNAQEAMEILKRDTGIDLLFTDVIMPEGVNGHDLALMIRTQFPAVKVLMTSGYIDKSEALTTVETNYITELTYEILTKPYTLSGLATGVWKALNK